MESKILIAEDDPTLRTILQAALAKLGYRVEVACDGNHAWAALQSPNSPKLVVLDWLMPGLTGPEICKRLRARQSTPYVYVILLTAMDGLNDLVEGIEAGADDYITKPFNSAELKARLRAGRRILDLQEQLLTAQKELELRATHDGLTGLWNHGAIIQRLADERIRAGRQRSSLGVILFDLDHFKHVNDTYGHLIGDHVLREAARRLGASMRPYDLVGRYGGEEFLVVLPDCGIRAAADVAERVRQAVSAAPVLTPAGPVAVTMSGGVSATLEGVVPETAELIEAADRALYRAKEAGRNRIIVDGVH